MNDERRVISVDDFEHNLLINGMNDYRNDLIEEELLIKLIDAPTKREKRKADRETRQAFKAKHHSVCFRTDTRYLAFFVDCTSHQWWFAGNN